MSYRVIVVLTALAAGGLTGLGAAQLPTPPTVPPAASAGDRAVLELDLPSGATASLDGTPVGDRRRFEFTGLTNRRAETHEVRASFASGAQRTWTVYVRGGWHVRLPVAPRDRDLPELMLQSGHSGGISGGINSAVISPDGKWLLTGAGEALLWDVASGQILREYPAAPASDVRAVAFHPNGREVMVVSRSGEVTFHEVTTGRVTRRLRHEGPYKLLQAAALSPDGLRVLTANNLECVWWDLATSRPIHKIQVTGSGSVDTVAISPDGKRALVSASNIDSVLWDLETGRHEMPFEKERKGGHAVAFSPDGRQMCVTHWMAAAIYDLPPGGPPRKRTEVETTNYINTVAFSPDGKQLISGLVDGPVIVWDATTGRQVTTFRPHGSAAVMCLVRHPNGRDILSMDFERRSVLWDRTTGAATKAFAGRPLTVGSVAFSADGGRLAIGGGDSVLLWDLSAGDAPRTARGLRNVFALYRQPRGSDFGVLTDSSENGCNLAAIDAAQAELATTSRSITIPPVPSPFTGRFRSILPPSKYGRYLVCADGSRVFAWRGGGTDVWETLSGRKLRTLTADATTFSEPCVSPDGRHLMMSFRPATDRSVELWSVDDGKLLHTLQDTRRMTALALTLGGREAITLSEGKTVTRWDVATGRRLKDIAWSGTALREYHAAVTYDGGRLIAETEDAALVVFDLEAGRAVHTLRGSNAPTDALTVSPDGRLLSASAGGAAWLWDLATGELLACLIRRGGQDWLAVTPEGLFDGSPTGREQVSFRVGGGLNVVPVERFFRDFYRPGLLPEIVKGGRPKPEVRLGQQLPPTVKILSPAQGGSTLQGEVTIEVEVTDAGGGMQEPRLVHNTATVLTEGRSERRGPSLRRTFRLQLAPGENVIQVQAASADGSWKSESATLTLRYTKPPERVNLYLLSAGVSRYADSSLNLKYAAADAKAMATLFATRGKGLFREVRPRTLTDAEATSANIRKAVQAIAAEARPEDVLVVFLAGHGTTVGSRYYYIPHDIRRSGTMPFEDDVRKQGLPGDVLDSWLQDVRATKRVIVYDTCHSGAALGGRQGGRDPFAFQGAIERIRQSNGAHTIAAAAAGEEAKEIDELGHGLLTYALLAGVRAVDRGPLADRPIRTNNPDDVVDVLEWFSYASGNVPRLAEQYYKVRQNVSVCSSENIFPLLPLESR